ncbi:MAG: hypothetical protein ABR863_09420 [Roseiarcus sp.]|jgi:hypothetical protein
MFVDGLRRLWRQPPPPAPPPPEPDRPKVDILSAAERDAIVASVLEPRLKPLGFVEVAPRVWVDGSTAPARRVFEMGLLKGAAMNAKWGFSLDFTPHLSGRRIAWHRSDRTAKLDVWLDSGRDYARFLYGAEWLRRDMERLADVAIAQAQETWRRGATWPGMLGLVREIRERKINRMFVGFRTRLPLAVMFLSAKVGDLAAAQAELEAYVRDRELPDAVAAKLAKLLGDVA